MKNPYKKDLTVVATVAMDIFLDSRKTELRKAVGGPLTFVKQALISENINFITRSTKAEVEIIVTNDSEIGRVSKRPSPIRVDLAAVQTPFLFISTVLDEVVLHNINEYTGAIFIDAQGFVRNGNEFGKKKMWNPDPQLLLQPLFLKTTAQELEYINAKATATIMRHGVLLVTDGRRGNTLYMHKKKYSISPERIVAPKDTVGAGDTLFVYFAAMIIKGKAPLKSIKYASSKTVDFLMQKSESNNFWLQ